MTVSWAECRCQRDIDVDEALVGTAEPLLATLPGVWREIAAAIFVDGHQSEYQCT